MHDCHFINYNETGDYAVSSMTHSDLHRPQAINAVQQLRFDNVPLVCLPLRLLAYVHPACLRAFCLPMCILLAYVRSARLHACIPA